MSHHPNSWQAQIASLESQLAAALAERDRLAEALKWYADPKVYELDEANGYVPDANFPIFQDDGQLAREALAAIERPNATEE